MDASQFRKMHHAHRVCHRLLREADHKPLERQVKHFPLFQIGDNRVAPRDGRGLDGLSRQIKQRDKRRRFRNSRDKRRCGVTDQSGFRQSLI